MKKIFGMLLVSLFSTSAMAQISNKFSIDAQMMMERATTSTQVKSSRSSKSPSTMPFIIRIDESCADETIEALRNAGAVLHARIGSQLSAEIPINCLEAVAKIEGVVRIGTAGAAPKPMTNVTRKEMGISSIDGSEGTIGDMAYTGKGVTVAVIDVGFDPNHPAFKDHEGRSRIKAYYSPFDTGGNPVVIDGMQLPGSVYDTPEQIAQLTTDSQEETHGTHTSTIAAGTRSPQGWGGMAPDADIVLCVYTDISQMSDDEFVETMTVNPTVFDALAFLKHYQEQSGQPMAVNMSIGNVMGPHNGRDEMAQAITEFIAPGRLVAISSANDGNKRNHLQKVFKSDTDTLRTMTNRGNLQLEGYTLKKAQLSAQLTLYKACDEYGGLVYDIKNEDLTWSPVWKSPVITAGPNGTYKKDCKEDTELTEIFDGELYLKLAFDEQLDMTQLNWNYLGIPSFGYAFELSVWSTAGTQIDFFGAQMEDMGRPNCSSSTTELSCNGWAAAAKAISVGNYCANATYQSLYNKEPESTYILGDIDLDSSYGMALNGRQIPMVTAPGTNITSGISQFFSDPSTVEADGTPKPHREDMTWQGGLYDCYTGTSMSSPAVAGMLALWLQANPTLSPEEVEDILKETCRNDEFTRAKPERFGYGKVDAKKGLELVLEHKANSIQELNDLSGFTPSASDTWYDLQGRPVNGKLTRGLYIKGGKNKKKVIR